MGQLIDGQWQGEDAARSTDAFERQAASFRDWVTADGQPNDDTPHGARTFPAEPGRYHLYVAWACPWAHRTLILRSLKGLQSMISVSVLHPLMSAEGWRFGSDREDTGEASIDHANGKRYLYEVYQAASSRFTGRVTVPVLWDRVRGNIVSNESADIVRMFNRAFDAQGAEPQDYYPKTLRAEIDTLNARIYETVNNGVYRAGFAGSQAAYEAAVTPLFETLGWLETRLATRRYLLGDATTEADWRLLPTLLRFDAIYAVHFKCSKRRLIDYPNLWAYTRDLYQTPGVADTFRLPPTLLHYYASHRSINPKGIVAVPPPLALDAPHKRAALGQRGHAHKGGVIAPRPSPEGDVPSLR